MASQTIGWDVLAVLVVVVLCAVGPCCSSESQQKDGDRGNDRHSILTGDHGVNGGIECGVCTAVLSLSEQKAEIHNETIVHALKRICSYLPDAFQLTCNTFLEVATPILIEMAFDEFITPDVGCHLLGFCYTEPGHPACHIYPVPSMGMERVLEKARLKLPKPYRMGTRAGSDLDCSKLPILKELCEAFEKKFIDDHLPPVDIDSDRFSVMKTLRGSYWRGKDCNDLIANIHPGARAIKQDEFVDSDCNGIYGIDPQFQKPYEDTLCAQTQRMGLAILGDSAGAHLHIPKEWVTATELNLEAFKDVAMIVENEVDWPMTSAVTGYMNSTWSVLTGPTDSLYLRMRQLNHCNHRDFQSIAVNGAKSKDVNDNYGISRDQNRDHPMLVMYSLIGNDVCNWHNDTIDYMTTESEIKQHFLSTLKFLDTTLPKGSHVIATSLGDGRILYNNLKNRIHPIGEWRQNVRYPDVYNYLSCLNISPCNGWMSPNESLRNYTSERAANLSRALREVTQTHRAENFDLHYINYDFHNIIKMWEAEGGETWQLIEPVDGFHPNQISMALGSEVLWREIERNMPDVIKTWTNPNNDRIRAIFGDQGGY